jgi:hypothetical protein
LDAKVKILACRQSGEARQGHLEEEDKGTGITPSTTEQMADIQMTMEVLGSPVSIGG